jgi:hypothetical protein
VSEDMLVAARAPHWQLLPTLHLLLSVPQLAAEPLARRPGIPHDLALDPVHRPQGCHEVVGYDGEDDGDGDRDGDCDNYGVGGEMRGEMRVEK